jgi:hypothetical protein
MADAAYQAVDPAGSVSIIDLATRTVKRALFQGVPTSGTFLRLPAATGMDFEPEYIAINHDDTLAFVTLQEAKWRRRAGSRVQPIHRNHRPRREGFQPEGK